MTLELAIPVSSVTSQTISTIDPVVVETIVMTGEVAAALVSRYQKEANEFLGGLKMRHAGDPV